MEQGWLLLLVGLQLVWLALQEPTGQHALLQVLESIRDSRLSRQHLGAVEQGWVLLLGLLQLVHLTLLTSAVEQGLLFLYLDKQVCHRCSTCWLLSRAGRYCSLCVSPCRQAKTKEPGLSSERRPARVLGGTLLNPSTTTSERAHAVLAEQQMSRTGCPAGAHLG